MQSVFTLLDCFRLCVLWGREVVQFFSRSTFESGMAPNPEVNWNSMMKVDWTLLPTASLYPTCPPTPQ